MTRSSELAKRYSARPSEAPCSSRFRLAESFLSLLSIGDLNDLAQQLSSEADESGTCHAG